MRSITLLLCVAIFYIPVCLAQGQTSISCNPALEGTELKINITWRNMKTAWLTKNFSESILFCSELKGEQFKCTSDSRFFAVNYSEVIVQGNQRTVMLKIPNAKMIMDGEWELTDNSGQFPDKKNCRVIPFSKEIKCQKTILQKNVNIQCETQSPSTKAKCHFNIINKNEMSKPKLGNIEYTHQGHPPASMSTSCKTNLLLDDDDALFDVEIDMFADVTGKDSDKEMGSRRMIIPFDFYLSASCSSPTIEGGTSRLSITWNNRMPIEIIKDHKEKITCLPDTPCSSTLDGPIMNIEPTMENGRTTMTLTFANVTRNDFPQGNSVWTVTILTNSASVTEMCHIYDPVEAIFCNYEPTSKGLNMTCNSPWELTRRKCQFKEKERIVPPENIVYDHSDHKTFCNSLVPWDMIDPKRPVVLVTIFPNVTGDYNDTIYGKSTTVELAIDTPSVELKECPLKIERGETISCECIGSSENVKVFWSTKSIKYDYTFKVTNFLADSFTEEWYCNGQNAFGFFGLPVTYKPEVMYPPFVTIGGDHPTNETVPDKLYITCGGKNESGSATKLVEESVAVSWRSKQYAEQSEKNAEKCENVKYFKCVFLAEYDDSVKTDFIECGPHIEPDTVTDAGFYLQVILIILLVTGLAVVALFILKKVKPAIFLSRSQEDQPEDVGGKDSSTSYL